VALDHDLHRGLDGDVDYVSIDVVGDHAGL